MWTHANKVTNLTNNDNEAYNSYLNKIISIPHPSVPKLTFALAKETVKAEDKLNKILAGVRTSKRDNPAYLRVQKQRETLQKNFQKGRIPLPEFMKKIGGLSLKSERKQGKEMFQTPEGTAPRLPCDQNERDDSDTDSLSETRPLDITVYPDDAIPDPTLVDFMPFAESVAGGRGVRGRGRGRGRPPRRGRGRGRGLGLGQVAVERVLCPSCGRGFQRNKVPPNWVNCVRCGDTYHDRHTHDGATGGQSDWICVKCDSPDTEDVTQTPEDQVPNQFPSTPALVTGKKKTWGMTSSSLLSTRPPYQTSSSRGFRAVETR